ncbi:AsnC family transcriptional regulator [Methylobacterium sp. SI9]|uniref:AsnC family transcriptional regulator n=1 Tax=Methylobacterium guangdongense TaxID=3138811 RepID=UPI00313BCB48
MLVEYTRRRGIRSPVTDAPTFRVGKLAEARQADQNGVDISHLIDRSYNYHSSRELHWHLADRLGLAPTAVTLREVRAA